MKRQELLFTAAAGLLLVAAALFPALSTASTIAPEAVSGNPNCGDIGYGYGFKVQQSPNGTFTFTNPPGELTGGALQDPYNSVTISNSNGYSFDWSATLGMDAVIVKGGNEGANVYNYFGELGVEVKSDTNLTTPTGQGISHIEFCYDYELTATKTANAEYTRTYTWDITKDVDPASHTGWFGDLFASSYDVFVDQTVTDSDYKVTGSITVNNPTPLQVTFSVSDSVNGTAADVDCPTDTLAAGASTICTYSASLVGAVDGINTATITSQNPAVGGATATAPYAFGDPTTIKGYPTINVTDYFDGGAGEALGSASGDFTFEYNRDFVCPTDEAAYTNGVYTRSFPDIAKIDETGQQDNANVDITCYKPVVRKDAATEWYKKYEWAITKSVNPASHTGYPGDEFSSDYAVVIDQTISEYGHRAFGTIYVTNPSGSAITVNVADAVNGTSASVDCDPVTAGNQTSLLVGAGATASCAYTVNLGGTTQLVNTATVSFNGHTFKAYADVIFGAPIVIGYPTVNVKDYFDGGAGEALGSASSDHTFPYDRDFVCPTNTSLYTGGVYTRSFPNIAKIEETGQWDDANVTITCTLPDFKVTKECLDVYFGTNAPFEPVDQDGPAWFKVTLENLSGAALLVTTDEVLLDMMGNTVSPPLALAAYAKLGPYYVKIDGPFTDLAQVVNTIKATGSYGTAWTAERSDEAACRVGSRVDLLKLTNGAPTTQVWDFKIYEGPDGFGGTEVASDTTPPELLDFNKTNLDPLETYTICELGVPAGYDSVWHIDTDGDGIGDVAVTPYNPDSDLNPPEDNGNRCVDFGFDTDILLEAGETLHFVVDNQSPGGAPRTPGYWKNWNWCSKGNQQYTAAKNGGWEAGFWLVEDVLAQSPGGAIVWGEYSISTCKVAVDILDKRLVGDPDVVGDGKKVASDPFHNLATHLLAAQLNFGAGACTTPDVLAKAGEAEALLDKYNFNGNGYDPVPKKSTDGTLANQLAEYLDQYNNGMFCGDTNANMTIQPVG